jgi:predicted dehydrogenase
LGIIGLGFGRAHIPAFQACGSTVVAVCQRNLADAKAIAERYGIPQVFERWEDLLEQPKPEIVVIATHLPTSAVRSVSGPSRWECTSSAGSP